MNKDLSRLNPSLVIYSVKYELERIGSYSRNNTYKGELKVSAYTAADAVHQVRTFLQYTTGLIENGVLFPFTYPSEDGRKITISEPLKDISISGPANIRVTTLPEEVVMDVVGKY